MSVAKIQWTAVVLIVLAVNTANAHVVYPGQTWETCGLAEKGLDESKIDEFIDLVGGDGVIIYEGCLVAAWGDFDGRADWASAAKPVIGTMLGFAVKEGKVTSPDDILAPLVRQHFKRDLLTKDMPMTWRHLANMTSGYARAEPPGEAWAYNDYAIMLYSQLLFDAVFAQTSDDAAMDVNRLGALQFEDGGIFGSRNGRGVNASPRDFARIGWFWLNFGNWDGVQLLPWEWFYNHLRPDVGYQLPRTAQNGEDYLKLGTFGGGSDQIKLGPCVYGFNWWFNKCSHDGLLFWPDARPDTFQANGNLDKEIMTVVPSCKMVVAARGDWGIFEFNHAKGGTNRRLQLLMQAAGCWKSP